MKPRLHHWGGALLLSSALHAAVFFYPKDREDQNAAKDLGVGGFEVSLSLQMAAAGSLQSAEEVSPTEEITEDQAPEITEVPEIEEIQEPTEVTELQPEPEPEPEPEPKKIQVEEVVERTPPDPIKEIPPVEEPIKETVQKLEEVKPTPIPKPVVTPPKKVEPKPEKVIPKPVQKTPEKQPVSEPVQKPGVKPTQTVAPTAVKKSAPAPTLVSQGAAQNAPAADRSDATNAEGGGKLIGSATPNYIHQVREWLERHKTYPKKAKRRRQQGVVTLAFTIDRQGRVLKFDILESSGIESLDKATIQMLEKANPLPAFPASMTGDILEFKLPVEFSLSD